MITIPFGFIERSAIPYIFIYQNVKLISSGSGSDVINLSCKVPTDKYTIVDSRVINKDNGLITELYFISEGTNFNFTCEVCQFIKIFKLNGKTLFTSQVDPNNLVIKYTDGMKVEITKWSFVDH